MKLNRWMHRFGMLAAGACLLQVGGCDLTGSLDFLQTVFLGISAAGAIAILRNI